MTNLKLALALSLALATAAQADVVFITSNKAGGLISLTDIPCKDAGRVVFSSRSTSNTVTMGCWTADNMNVIIRWNDGDVGLFPNSAWIQVPEKKGTNL